MKLSHILYLKPYIYTKYNSCLSFPYSLSAAVLTPDMYRIVHCRLFDKVIIKLLTVHAAAISIYTREIYKVVLNRYILYINVCGIIKLIYTYVPACCSVYGMQTAEGTTKLLILRRSLISEYVSCGNQNQTTMF